MQAWNSRARWRAMSSRQAATIREYHISLQYWLRSQQDANSQEGWTLASVREADRLVVGYGTLTYFTSIDERVWLTLAASALALLPSPGVLSSQGSGVLHHGSAVLHYGHHVTVKV